MDWIVHGEIAWANIIHHLIEYGSGGASMERRKERRPSAVAYLVPSLIPNSLAPEYCDEKVSHLEYVYWKEYPGKGSQICRVWRISKAQKLTSSSYRKKARNPVIKVL